MKKRLMALVLCLTVMMTMFAPLANATEEDLLSTPTPTPTPAPAAATVEPQAESAHESAAPTEAHTEQPSAHPAETVGQEVTAAPAETAASPVEEDVSGMIAVTAGSDVNLRTAPGRDSESLGKIAQSGTAVKPLKKVTLPGGEVWYAVEYEGCTGYIFGDLLALSAESAAAETPAAAATPETQETPAPVITEPDAVYTYEFSNTTSEVIYGYQATATLGQSVSVPRNGRVVLSGPAGQWQILVGGVWADLAGADSGVALTYALLKNAGSSTRIRCLDAAGNSQGESAVTLTDAVSVAAPAQEPVLKKTPLRAAAPAALAADVNAGEGEQDNPAPSTYTIIINYQFADGKQAAPSWSAQVATGSTYTQDIQSPTVVGYTPDQPVVQVNTSEAKTYTVTYQPAEVDFTVKHYQQNVSNDEYTLVDTETKKGRTESKVGDNLAKTYDGFYSLLYDTTTTIAADGSTVVEIYYDRYYYLMNFDLGGGYGVEPIYARYGASISIGKPQKAGYSFTGWNNKIPETMPAENSTYTAQWQTVSVGFTVVFWYENADDEDYSVAGTYTPADVAPGTNVKSDDYKNQSFTGRDATHFTYNAAKAETVTVAGDGSTVLNVYYTRNTYTLTFKNAQYTTTCGKEEHKHTYDDWQWNGYPSFKGGCYPSDKYSTTPICGKEEHTHNWNCNGKYSDLKITAKYGADIHGNFPIKDGDKTIWWNVPNDCNSFKPGTQLGSIDIMPGENITFTKDDSESGADIYYYIETLAGEEGTYTHDGKSFKLYKTINLSRGDGKYLTYTEEFHDITGFTQWWSDPAFDQMAQGGRTSGINSKNYLCYTRNSYKLQFYNYNKFVADKERTVQYEAPLKDYGFTPDYPANLEANAYKFAGWYTTAGCYPGSEADLNTMTMPASDMILYAKWAPVTHTVKTYLTKDVLDNSGETLQTWNNVPHGTAVTNPPADPTRAPYKFVGWFYISDNGEEKAFVFSMPVNRDLNLYAKWNADVLITYTIKYQLEDGTEIAPPTTGSALAGSTKTFEAKTGTQLNEGCQSGYFPKVSSHSLTMDIEGNAENKKNEYTFVYVAKPEVEYTVRYLDKATGEPVVVDGVSTPDKTVTTSDAVVTETFKQITGYAPDAYQKRLVLAAEGNEIIFWYTKDTEHAPVQIIHWVQNNEGAGYTEYQSSTNLNGIIGETYTEQPLTLDGFTYKADKSTSSGKLTAAGLVLNLYYDRIEYPYTFRFLEQGTNKVLADSVTDSARYQAQVTQTAKNIPGYTLVSANQQAINIAIEDPADVAAKNVKIFYYVEQTVEIKYEVIGPEGCGTLDNYLEAQLKVKTGTVNGSTPTAAEGYRFVGWFKDEAGTQPVDSDWVVNNKITPEKSKNLGNDIGTIMVFEAATYYAKFVKQTNVTIEKKVTGNLGDKTREFEFQYSLDGTNWSNTFKLKHDQTFTTPQKLDVGATIYVREKAAADYSTTASHASGTLDVDNDGEYKKVTVTVLDSDKVTFTNNKEATPDTGVLLDSLPYVVILAVVVLGAALVIVRRRKHRDDD